MVEVVFVFDSVCVGVVDVSDVLVVGGKIFERIVDVVEVVEVVDVVVVDVDGGGDDVVVVVVEVDVGRQMVLRKDLAC